MTKGVSTAATGSSHGSGVPEAMLDSKSSMAAFMVIISVWSDMGAGGSKMALKEANFRGTFASRQAGSPPSVEHYCIHLHCTTTSRSVAFISEPKRELRGRYQTKAEIFWIPFAFSPEKTSSHLFTKGIILQYQMTKSPYVGVL